MSSTKECWTRNLQIGWNLAKESRKQANYMKCVFCGKLFTRRGKRKLNGKFGSCCSVVCKNLNLRGKIVRKVVKRGQQLVCKICGSGIYAYPSHPRKYCSIKCRTNDDTFPKYGESHYKWKGGIKYHRGRDRSLRKWMRAIIKRDGRNCLICKKTQGEMCIDHILPWADFPTLRYNLINGQTLCKSCHAKKTKRENKNRDRKGRLKNGYKKRIWNRYQKSGMV